MKKIRNRVSHLVKKYGTREPEKLAAYLGIEVSYEDLEEDTKGFFIRILRNKFIVINSNLSEEYRRIVLAHEIGHAVFHSSRTSCFIREYTLFPRGKQENEANTFAAELLIDEGNIDIYFLQSASINQLSYYFGVPERLIMCKFFE